jgi:hypothetical protein
MVPQLDFFYMFHTDDPRGAAPFPILGSLLVYAALKLYWSMISPRQTCSPWIIKHVEIDGEAKFRIHAKVYEGPGGESEFGAARIKEEFSR